MIKEYCKTNYIYATAENCKACKHFGVDCKGIYSFTQEVPVGGYFLFRMPGEKHPTDMIYIVRNNLLYHNGKTYTVGELNDLCNEGIYFSQLKDVIKKDCVICFKGEGEPRQTHFTVKRNALDGVMFGLVMETGELIDVDTFMKENGYTESDIVNILSAPEEHKNRSFARRRYKR